MLHKLSSAELLADSFLHYPLMTYAFEGRSEEERKSALLQLYTPCVQAAEKFGGVLVNAEQTGTLIWLPGKNFPLGLWREIQSGMATIPFRVGVKSTLRLMNHDSVPEGWIAKNAGANFGYIWCVGVLESERGKGLSRQLFDQSIEAMRAQGMTAFWLKTDDPKNVLIYQKLGFEIQFETVVKSSGIRTWAMRRV